MEVASLPPYNDNDYNGDSNSNNNSSSSSSSSSSSIWLKGSRLKRSRVKALGVSTFAGTLLHHLLVMMGVSTSVTMGVSTFAC